MSALAHLSGSLPQGDANGLSTLLAALLDRPRDVHVLVALVDCAKITRNVDTGGTIPTIRIRRVEAITDAGDREHLRRLLEREFERRTGHTMLPFDLEQDVSQAFKDVDADADGEADS